MIQAALFTRTSFCVTALTLGLAATSGSHAISGAGIELGYGVESTKIARINARWDWNKRWAMGEGWNASGFWEAGLGSLQSSGAGERHIWDVGVMPVMRLRSGVSRFYVEGGIGGNLLSENRLNHRRKLGSHLLFGDLLGFGWNFGEQDRYELGYRFLHYANADLAEPNDGLNLHLIRLGYNY